MNVSIVMRKNLPRSEGPAKALSEKEAAKCKQSVTKKFFKVFYLFGMLNSSVLFSESAIFKHSYGFADIFELECIAVFCFCFLCLIFNFLNFIRKEKLIAYWSSVFLGLVIVGKCVYLLKDGNPVCELGISLSILFFIIAVFRYLYLRDKIRNYYTLIGKRLELLAKTEDD